MLIIFDYFLGCLQYCILLIWFNFVAILALCRGIFQWGNPIIAHWTARVVSYVLFPLFGLSLEIEYHPEAKQLLFPNLKANEKANAHEVLLSHNKGKSITTPMAASSSSSSMASVPQPCIIMPNHQNNIDVIIAGITCPDNSVALAKAELKYVPIFGQLWSLAGNVWINRQDRARAIKQVQSATTNAKQRHFAIFPEGTRNQKMNSLLPFKKGPFHLAIDAQSPIVCLVFSSYKWLQNSRTGWVSSGKIYAKYLKPIPTKGLTKQDLPDLMARVRKVMIEAYIAHDIRISNETGQPRQVGKLE